jgi:voltage-gated potassium channel Kch
MRKITLGQRLRYRFDNVMSKGAPALIGWLAILSVAVVAVVALLVTIGGMAPVPDKGPPRDFPAILWTSLLHTWDSGVLSSENGAWPYLAAMLVLTLGGVFVVSALIGILTNSIQGRLNELRKGRSLVLEDDHTVILGWSSQVFSILSELAIANANRGRSCVVVLADKDKVEMEDEIRAKVGRTGRMRIICRTGNPIDATDLDIANLHSSRSIIVLAGDDEDTDSQVIKTVLAITNSARRRSESYHIVAEIHESKNMEVARMVGGDEVKLIEVNDVIARLAAQTCRQSGLSTVYSELLDFEGDEIYFQEEPALVGKSFGDALLAYETSSVIGLHLHDGRVVLNPPASTIIAPGDRVIAISEDDDTVKLSGITEPKIDVDAIRSGAARPPQPEKALVLGWNRGAPTIINELDGYVAPGSAVTVVAGFPEVESELLQTRANLVNQALAFEHGDTTDRRTLEKLYSDDYQHVIVLAYSDDLDVQRADARTLVTLLHLRDIRARSTGTFSIVSEMLDIRNKELAEVTQADDFIVSDRLISLMLAQVSENRYLNAVFDDLFSAEGSEIYLKPVGDYVRPGPHPNFYTVVEAARRRNEVAIGYRLQVESGSAARSYGIVVNPDKSKPLTLSDADRIIVLAED